MPLFTMCFPCVKNPPRALVSLCQAHATPASLPLHTGPPAHELSLEAPFLITSLPISFSQLTTIPQAGSKSSSTFNPVLCLQNYAAAWQAMMTEGDKQLMSVTLTLVNCAEKLNEGLLLSYITIYKSILGLLPTYICGHISVLTSLYGLRSTGPLLMTVLKVHTELSKKLADSLPLLPGPNCGLICSSVIWSRFGFL